MPSWGSIAGVVKHCRKFQGFLRCWMMAEVAEIAEVQEQRLQDVNIGYQTKARVGEIIFLYLVVRATQHLSCRSSYHVKTCFLHLSCTPYARYDHVTTGRPLSFVNKRCCFVRRKFWTYSKRSYGLTKAPLHLKGFHVADEQINQICLISSWNQGQTSVVRIQKALLCT